MSSEKENKMSRDDRANDRSNPSSKYGGQQERNPAKKDRDADAERQPEGREAKQKDFKKDDQKYNDKSDRV